MLAERGDLLARLYRIEDENRKLQTQLDQGRVARLVSSPSGRIAIAALVLVGVLAGYYGGKLDEKNQSFMGNVF